jgi:hypothetical protein
MEQGAAAEILGADIVMMQTDYLVLLQRQL